MFEEGGVWGVGIRCMKSVLEDGWLKVIGFMVVVERKGLYVVG